MENKPRGESINKIGDKNVSPGHHAAATKKPVRQNGLPKKTKQTRFPVPVAYNLAEEGGFRIALRALHLVG